MQSHKQRQLLNADLADFAEEARILLCSIRALSAPFLRNPR
jgi:hypothetical protein